MSREFDARAVLLEDNYVVMQKFRLLQHYVRLCGFRDVDDMNYVPYHTIQNDVTQEQVIRFLPALRTVYQTQEVRSITNKRQDKRLVLNVLRQLLKSMGYRLESKTYHLINNGRITSSSKYRIVKVVSNTNANVLPQHPPPLEDCQGDSLQNENLTDADEHRKS